MDKSLSTIISFILEEAHLNELKGSRSYTHWMDGWFCYQGTQFKHLLDNDINGLKEIAELGRLVNQIPKGITYGELQSHSELSQVYKDILVHADIEDDDTDLDYTSIEHYDIFEMHRDKYYQAVKEFNHAVITSTSKLEKREVANKAFSAWKTIGKKDLVEANILENARNVSNSALWKVWSDKINVDLDMRADKDGISYPIYSLDLVKNWTSIRVKKKLSEVIQKIECSDLVSLTGDLDQYYSIEFEYCSFKILRNWFSEELFESNFWSLGSNWIRNIDFVSKGDNSFEGLCPAYISELIFIKNVTFKEKRKWYDHLFYELDASVVALGDTVLAMTKIFSFDKIKPDDKIYLAGILCNYLPKSPKL